MKAKEIKGKGVESKRLQDEVSFERKLESSELSEQWLVLWTITIFDDPVLSLAGRYLSHTLPPLPPPRSEDNSETAPGSSSSTTTCPSGFCLIGSAGGRLRVLRMCDGMALSPSSAYLLGGPVVFVDLFLVVGEKEGEEKSHCRALATTMEGDVWVWSIDGGTHESFSLVCLYRTRLNAVLSALRFSKISQRRALQGGGTREAEAEAGDKIDRVVFDERGRVVVSVRVDGTPRYIAFRFCSVSQLWHTTVEGDSANSVLE